MFSTFDFVPVILDNKDGLKQFPYEKPPHVQLFLMEKIVASLRGLDESPSTGETAARTSWVMDEMVREYYGTRIFS